MSAGTVSRQQEELLIRETVPMTERARGSERQGKQERHFQEMSAKSCFERRHPPLSERFRMQRL